MDTQPFVLPAMTVAAVTVWYLWQWYSGCGKGARSADIGGLSGDCVNVLSLIGLETRIGSRPAASGRGRARRIVRASLLAGAIGFVLLAFVGIAPFAMTGIDGSPGTGLDGTEPVIATHVVEERDPSSGPVHPV